MENKKTMFGIVPNKWIYSTIGDSFELRQGLQISKKLRQDRKSKYSIPLLKITDLPTKKFTEYVTQINDNYIANENDIIYTRTGQVGLVYTNVYGCVHNNCFKVLYDSNKFDKNFVYYLLNNNIMREYANSIASGSVQKDLTHKAFKMVNIAYPYISEQKKVGDILAALDSKIQLNNEMNKTLEEIAQATFKSWFVDFEPLKGEEFEKSELGMIPKGWKVGTLGELIEVNPKTPLIKGDKYRFVDMGNVPTNSARINVIINKEFSGGGSRFKNEDVIFARITPCLENGKTAIIDFLNENEVAFGSTEFLVFRGIGWNAMYYAYCLSRYDPFRVYAIQHMNGSSGRQRVSKGDIEDYKIVIPPKEILLEFNKQVSCYFEKIKQNDLNSNNLKEIRDTLLPKLISGEIKLNDSQ